MYKIINSSEHLRVPAPLPGILKSSVTLVIRQKFQKQDDYNFLFIFSLPLYVEKDMWVKYHTNNSLFYISSLSHFSDKHFQTLICISKILKKTVKTNCNGICAVNIITLLFLCKNIISSFKYITLKNINGRKCVFQK